MKPKWCVGLYLTGLVAAAQQSPPALEAIAVADGIYYFKGGSGANTGLIVGAKEAVIVDAKMTEDSARAMLEQARKLTPNPITRVILTHSDGDHVNGLAGFPKDLTIIAHANARKDMEEAFKDPKLSALRDRLPSEVVEGNRTLELDGLRIELLHFGPAHTNGDLVVYVPARRVAFVGDLVFIGREPLIHRHKSGSSTGLIETLKKLLELEADKYISGHADPASKEDLRQLLASLEQTRAKVRQLIAEGKSLEEIKATFGVGTQATPGRRPGLIEVIYLDLTEKR